MFSPERRRNVLGNDPLRHRSKSTTSDRSVARRARAAKDLAESDRLRDELAALGVAVKDNKDGTTTWEPKR